jgi:ATP-dependent Clp protease ATP-binding subunit ClpC
VDQYLLELVEQARSGEDEAFERLVNELRRLLDVATLVECARHDEAFVRRAAVVAGKHSTDPRVLDALRELVSDSDDAVRLSLAEAIADAYASWWPFDSAIHELLHDENSEVRQWAVKAAARRPALEVTLVARLSQDDSWRVRQEIAMVLGNGTPRAVLPVLLSALAEDGDSDVRREAAVAAERLLGRLGGYPADLLRPPLGLLRNAHDKALGLRAGLCPQLLSWLEERVNSDVDVEGLKAFGSLLTLEAEAGRLPRAHEADEAVEAVLKILMGDAPRAAVVVGEAGVGKTAVIYEVVHRLRQYPGGPWYVLRISPAEFLAGTVYLGEWETKVRNLVQAVRQPRRALLYVPNLEELAMMGMTSKSDANVATALAPHIERGEVVILGESNLESFRKGLGAVRSLRRLFHAVQLPPAEPEDTRAILQAIALEAGAAVEEPVLDRLMEVADFYVSGTAEPGRSAGLLRRLLGVAGKRSEPIGERDILTTISSSTGIPVDFLDDSVPLDRADLRRFFESRVMGQPEAVDAVVDLVTLVKAGLTDPNKPFGVLLFVGPTGVGKTELARALAECLFGDPARMIRLDMSEYATYEAFERLIGVGTTPGLLTSVVRERPFSVLLLDEIEKAHFNVFDLCLQIFDAGRLTDSQGRTADFRRTIIILTSNVGSRIVQEAPVGFGRAVPPPPDASTTLRDLSRSFRPEFLNRIDRIVTFRPLSAETAEKIARRELAAVVERTGITRRRLVVSVDDSVVPLLLREGYSPAYGARPLKRTVERLILLPAARVIAAGETPPGSILRLVARRGRVEVEIESPDALDAAPEAVPPAPHAVPVADRAAALLTRIAQLRDSAAPLNDRKSELLVRAAAPGLWDNRSAAQALYDEVYRIDGVLAALDNLDRAVREQVDAISRARTSERELTRIDERLDALEGQAHHVSFLVNCRNPRDLGDAFVVLTLASRHGADLEAVPTLARMYINLARRHHFEVDVLDDRCDGVAEDVIVLLAGGAGAHALLCGEAGLHQVARGRGEERHGKRAVDRSVVRVEVLPVPAEDSANIGGPIHAEAHPLGEVTGRLLERPKLEVHLRHEPSLLTVRAWTDRPRSEAIDVLKLLLRARVANAESPSTEGRTPVVRRYSLGPAPLVRDARSGRTTGRLDQVLNGHLDLFLTPPRSAGQSR